MEGGRLNRRPLIGRGHTKKLLLGIPAPNPGLWKPVVGMGQGPLAVLLPRNEATVEEEGHLG